MADWGDVPSWINSVATLFALVFAAVAAVSARRVYRIESERDRLAVQERRHRDDSERRNQAVLVSAWWGVHEDQDGDPVPGSFVRNASATPVYDAHVTVSGLHDPDGSESLRIATVSPGSEAGFYPGRRRLGGIDGDGPSSDFRVELTFTDSAGVRWIRDKQGQLSELLPELTIWTDNLRVRSLERTSSEFLSSENVNVTFRCPSVYELRSEFLDAVGKGECPDILIGPHDWIAELAAERLIEPVSLPAERLRAFVPKAVEAMRWNGKLWGVPYAADSVALLRNLDLVPHAPRTMEELLEQGRALCADGRVDEPLAVQVGPLGDMFHTYPFFASVGVRLFAPSSGSWDPGRLTTPNTAGAYRRLSGMGEYGDRVLRREITRDRSLQLFVSGRAPFIICPPWVVGRAREAGIRFATSPVPPFDGESPTRSPIAVHGFYFPSVGRNKVIARRLILDFLTRVDMARVLHTDQPRTPALAAAFDSFNAEDVHGSVFREQFVQGDLIPSVQNMSTVWTALNRAQADIIGGGDVDQALRALRNAVT